MEKLRAQLKTSIKVITRIMELKGRQLRFLSSSFMLCLQPNSLLLLRLIKIIQPFYKQRFVLNAP